MDPGVEMPLDAPPPPPAPEAPLPLPELLFPDMEDPAAEAAATAAAAAAAELVLPFELALPVEPDDSILIAFAAHMSSILDAEFPDMTSGWLWCIMVDPGFCCCCCMLSWDWSWVGSRYPLSAIHSITDFALVFFAKLNQKVAAWQLGFFSIWLSSFDNL